MNILRKANKEDWAVLAYLLWPVIGMILIDLAHSVVIFLSS